MLNLKFSPRAKFGANARNIKRVACDKRKSKWRRSHLEFIAIVDFGHTAYFR